MKNIMELQQPIFLMNPPFSLSSSVVNNAIMEEMSAAELKIDMMKAFEQFQSLYKIIAAESIVYLLPSRMGLQDQTYVANVGAVLPHLSDATVIISRFKSDPRKGEEDIAEDFFRQMQFKVAVPPAFAVSASAKDSIIETEECRPPNEIFFEGEADLKYLTDNVYVGAHGMRTSLSALEWIEERFNARIIPVKIKHPRLYHLDCSIFPLPKRVALVCTEALDQDEVKKLEKYVEIIDVPLNVASHGATNCLLLGKKLIFSSDVSDLKNNDRHYRDKKEKLEFIISTCENLSLIPTKVNLSEFEKSGADLSCMIMHINYNNIHMQ